MATPNIPVVGAGLWFTHIAAPLLPSRKCPPLWTAGSTKLPSPVTPCVNSTCEGSLTPFLSNANSCQHTILTGWLMQVKNPLSPVGQSASLRDGTGRRDLNWLTSRRPESRLHACEVYGLEASNERQGLCSEPGAHDKYWLAEACQEPRFKVQT